MQCNLKRDLCLLSRNSSDCKFKNCYKAICKSPSDNIVEAKCYHYNKLVCNSTHKISTTWKIIKTDTCRADANECMSIIIVNGNLINNPQLISGSFNNNFLFIAHKILNKIQSIHNSNSSNHLIAYLRNAFKNSFPNITFNYVSRHEIEKVIKSLKSSNSYSCDEISVKIVKESFLQ